MNHGPSLPSNAAERKASPMAEGLLYYFPNALAAVAAVSKAGNDQHNPGQPMHHARGKSMDHADCIIRHLVDSGTLDTDGQRHTAKVAWRALALLQEEIERDEGVPLPRNAVQDTCASTQHGYTGDVDTLGRTFEGLAKRIHDQALAADVAWSTKRDATLPYERATSERFTTTQVGDDLAPNDWCVHVTPAAWADPQAENLRAYGIGDVPHESRHPMSAEADRLSAGELV